MHFPRVSGPKKPWQPQRWQDLTRFSPLDFSLLSPHFRARLTKLHINIGEKKEKIHWRASNGDGAPKLQIADFCPLPWSKKKKKFRSVEPPQIFFFRRERGFPHFLGVPKPGCFKIGCLQFLRGNALLRPFSFFCALLRTCVCVHKNHPSRFCHFARAKMDAWKPLCVANVSQMCRTFCCGIFGSFPGNRQSCSHCCRPNCFNLCPLLSPISMLVCGFLTQDKRRTTGVTWDETPF